MTDLAARQRQMRAADHELTAQRLRVIRARRAERWSIARIAGELGLPPSTVRKLMLANDIPTGSLRHIASQMTPAQAADYRVLTGKGGYPAAEARKMLGIG